MHGVTGPPRLSEGRSTLQDQGLEGLLPHFEHAFSVAVLGFTGSLTVFNLIGMTFLKVSPVDYFKRLIKIGPKAFSRYCLWTAAFWLLVVHSALLWFFPQVLPTLMKPSIQHVDVYQYYSGAVVVKDHLWDSLYPIPKATCVQRAEPFCPSVPNFSL